MISALSALRAALQDRGGRHVAIDEEGEVAARPACRSLSFSAGLRLVGFLARLGDGVEIELERHHRAGEVELVGPAPDAVRRTSR